MASSVGWLGAVLVYLVLGLAGMTADDTALVAGVYVAMDWAAWVALVPLAVASLLTGIAQALISPWGLWRHYWVIVKLAITALATAVLLLYTQTLSTFAAVAGHNSLAGADLALLQSASVVVHSTGALVVLSIATILAVYKPAGLTRREQRRRYEERRSA